MDSYNFNYDTIPSAAEKGQVIDRKQLTRLFSLIIRKHPDAMKEVERTLETSPTMIHRKLEFWNSTDIWSTLSNCRCGVIHETFGYMSAGKLDEEQFDEIIRYIELGRCIHSDGKPWMFVPGEMRSFTASVHLIHAAAAVGNIPVLETLMKINLAETPLTGMLGASALHIAIYLRQTASKHFLLTREPEVLSDFCGKSKLSSKSGDILLNKSILMLCHEVNDMETAKLIIQTQPLQKEWVEDAMRVSDNMLEWIWPYITKDLIKLGPNFPHRLIHFAFLNKIDRLVLLIAQKYVENKESNRSTLVYFATLAVIYNNSQILAMLLRGEPETVLEGLRGEPETVLEGHLVDLAFILGARECADVLEKSKLSKSRHSSSVSPSCLVIDIVFYLLDYRTQTLDYLIRKVAQRHSIHQRTTDGDTPLLYSLKFKRGMCAKKLLEFGGDVNEVDRSGSCPLKIALDTRIPLPPDIVLEMLYFNPSLSISDSAGISIMQLALRYDEVRYPRKRRCFTGHFVIHSRDLPVEFGPLISCILLDCGYDLRNDIKMRSKGFDVYKQCKIAAKRLQEVVCSRIQEELLKPKCLQQSCRDVLRRHFSGHALHSFVSDMKLPNRIAKFILMESILKKQ